MSSPRMVKADVRLGGSAESPCHPNPSPMLPAHEPKRAKPRVPPAWASRRNKGHGSGPGCPGVGGGAGQSPTSIGAPTLSATRPPSDRSRSPKSEQTKRPGTKRSQTQGRNTVCRRGLATATLRNPPRPTHVSLGGCASCDAGPLRCSWFRRSSHVMAKTRRATNGRARVKACDWPGLALRAPLRSLVRSPAQFRVPFGCATLAYAR